MASWGYRVYTFELFEGNTKLAQEIPAHRERLLDALKLVGEKTRVGKPHRNLPVNDVDDLDTDELYSEDVYLNTEPTLSIRNTTFDNELGVIHSSIALGERGLHDYAINPDDGSDRLAVDDRSAETPRRVDIFFATAQFEGILVAEAVGMKDPIPLLVPWIRKVSTEQRKSRLFEIEETDQNFDDAGNPISKTAAKKAVSKTTKIRVERVADPALLRQILNDISSMDTEFTQIDEYNKETNKRLIVKVTDSTARRKIIERLTQKDAGSNTLIVKQALNDLDVDETNLAAANIDLNTVRAHIRSSEGNATLVPGKLSELFNYRFKSSGRPTNTPYYRTILTKIEQLKVPAQIALSVPEDSTMIDWIEDEESAWNRQEIENHV